MAVVRRVRIMVDARKTNLILQVLKLRAKLHVERLQEGLQRCAVSISHNNDLNGQRTSSRSKCLPLKNTCPCGAVDRVALSRVAYVRAASRSPSPPARMASKSVSIPSGRFSLATSRSSKFVRTWDHTTVGLTWSMGTPRCEIYAVRTSAPHLPDPIPALTESRNPSVSSVPTTSRR